MSLYDELNRLQKLDDTPKGLTQMTYAYKCV